MKMNIDNPKLTAYALDELDESERSAIARVVAESPEAQHFIADTQQVARLLKSQYGVELERELVARERFIAVHDDSFWLKASPLAISALIAVLAVIGAVMFSSNVLRISPPSRSNLPHHLAGDRAQPNQFAPVEAGDIARPSQNEKLEADAGPYAFTGERPFVSVI